MLTKVPVVYEDNYISRSKNNGAIPVHMQEKAKTYNNNIVPQASTAAAAALLCNRQSWNTAYQP